MRFGNTAFRGFCQKVYPINKAFVAGLLKSISLEEFKKSLQAMEEQGRDLGFASSQVEEVITVELATYLDECFGNEVGPSAFEPRPAGLSPRCGSTTAQATNCPLWSFSSAFRN